MLDSYIDTMKLLKDSDQPYATATIVRRKKPSSGKPGDKAIITKDGQIHGWIGGGCTRGIVLKEALLSLKDREPRMVSISPNKRTDVFDNTKTYTMTCQSGGEVEVYIEPVLPKPTLVILGTSYIAISLAKIAKAMDYRVDVYTTVAEHNIPAEVNTLKALEELDVDEIKASAYMVVCTQGQNDVPALVKALSSGTEYVSFVASMKKANAIFAELRDVGIGFEQLEKIKTPAGLDINAKTPDEVAISILAEVIKHFRTPSKDRKSSSDQIELQNDDFYMNPVCNIPVQKSTAKHILEYEGEKVYFCCDGCKVSFEAEPEKYMVVE